MIECANGATLLLSVDGKTMRFYSRTPNEILFNTTMPSFAPTIGCGALPGGGVPAVIVYRAEETNGSLGEPLSVDIGEQP
jgi:hypothetical protein